MSDTLVHDDTQRIPPQPRPRSGCGCWIPALLTLFVVGVLVVIGLFLPPVNLWDRLFGVQYAMLDADANAVQVEGLTLVVDPADPGQGFGVVLDALPMTNFMAGVPEWTAARAAIPFDLALQSPVYTLDTTGQEPDTLTLDLVIPPAGSADLLSVYGWYPQRGGWEFIPARLSAAGTLTAMTSELPALVGAFQVTPPQQPTVLVAVDVVQTLSADAAQVSTIIAPAGLQPTLDGRLTGGLAAGFDANAGYLVMPVIRNFTDPRAVDPQTVATILDNRTIRAEHVMQIAAFASAYDGVVIDYREIPAESRAGFSAFAADLGAALDDLGLSLVVVVPAAQNVAGQWETGAYDWRAIGEAADLMQIILPDVPPTYTPGPDQLVEAMLRWGVGEVDRRKLLIGLSARSVRETEGNFTTIGFAEALAGLGDVAIEAEMSEGGMVLPGTEITARLDGLRAQAGVEAEIQAPFIEYLAADGGPVARMWLTTGEALRFRMDRTIPLALAGVGLGDLLAGDLAPDVLPAIFSYKLGVPAAPTARELALRWRIESAGGVIGERTTGLNDDLVVTIAAPDGNYAVNVEVVDGEVAVPRGGAAVALFAPTMTPTPLPTATPSPTPTPSPVPRAVAPAPVAEAPSGGGMPAVVPGAGSISVGTFEYGGHVTNTNSERAASAMRRAGMNWMKVQVRYGRGQGADSVAGVISDARARGFRVLLGVVGSPNELGAGGTGYMDDFANFLGGVAGLGPDAIEVWNEPNIDREWPTGQISGAAYTEMLRRAYSAIKGANGSVMVISGAPAPTGAEAAFPGRVMNDDRWLGEVVASGGLQYMDCVGVHYNEGIVPPNVTNGDPRDNYYTRYFPSMVDVYWGLVGGQKPLCFTELGYLSPEGFGSLDPFFGWAQNVTVAQQAAWLAQAAAMASQSGRVRLFIVWNVDFTLYGSDPQAGYAMIRPDGSCPACDALAGAR